MKKMSLVEEAVRLAVRRGVKPLRLALTGDKKITLYAAPKPEERDDRVFPHMWFIGYVSGGAGAIFSLQKTAGRLCRKLLRLRELFMSGRSLMIGLV